MKSGLLVYPSDTPYCNLGDYVQSLAARQFLARVDQYVGREELNEYLGEDLKVIMNGWFMHRPHHWPPSSSIRPLFVSFHINSVARAELTSDASVAYLKKWAPIGCRDLGTAQLLRDAGVDAYFSGCLTLTLGRTWKRKEPTAGIVFVDPHVVVRKDPGSVAAYIATFLSRPRTIARIAREMVGRADLRSMLRAAAFWQLYRTLFSREALETATYVRQELPSSELGGHSEKFARAEALLELYSRARFVVTSRIHCALPCTGIGVPVLFIEDRGQAETSWCRLDGLRELLHVVQSDGAQLRCELTNGEIRPEFAFANKTGHLDLAASLANKCGAFATASERARSAT